MNRDITVSSIETGPYCVNTYFVRLNNSDECVVIDPADAGKVNTYLEKNGLGCNAILLTHCHFDHMLGVPELQKQGMKVYIGELDEAGLRDKDINLTFRKIEPFYADVKLKDGDTVRGWSSMCCLPPVTPWAASAMCWRKRNACSWGIPFSAGA